MLRSTIAILLFLLFAVQSFQRVLIIIDYYANKAAFISKCENRAKPQMKCNGSCIMMKKLQADQSDHQKYPDLKLENKNDVLFSDESVFEEAVFPGYNVVHHIITTLGKAIHQPRNLFRPPLRMHLS